MIFFRVYYFNFAGSTVDRDVCPYVFMANSQADMEEWVRALRRVTGVPNGGLAKRFVLTETDDRQCYSRQLWELCVSPFTAWLLPHQYAPLAALASLS